MGFIILFAFAIMKKTKLITKFIPPVTSISHCLTVRTDSIVWSDCPLGISAKCFPFSPMPASSKKEGLQSVALWRDLPALFWDRKAWGNSAQQHPAGVGSGSQKLERIIMIFYALSSARKGILLDFVQAFSFHSSDVNGLSSAAGQNCDQIFPKTYANPMK